MNFKVTVHHGGWKIDCIKVLRSALGISLKEAKDAVCGMQNEHAEGFYAYLHMTGEQLGRFMAGIANAIDLDQQRISVQRVDVGDDKFQDVSRYSR